MNEAETITTLGLEEQTMTTHQHEIYLDSEEHFNGRLPTHHLGLLMVDLPIWIRGAVSMALRNRSKAPGKQPRWLKEASDVRFADHSGNGVTKLQFELPSLDDAASDVYDQKLLFDIGRPNGKLTGLDLLMNVVRDIDASKADSETFDPQLLMQISKFKRFFRSGPFTGFRISGSTQDANEQVSFTQATVENSMILYGRTPSPQRARIVGKLDGMEASTQRFSLILDSGERVAGVFPEELSEQLQGLWRKRVLVLGTSIFRASGNLLRIDADAVENGENEASLFSKVPVAGKSRLDVCRLRKSQGSRSGMAAIMGQWPGDETDLEIEEALERIS